jgi:C4-dicarboxylate-specific signal transduction histidine kinase
MYSLGEMAAGIAHELNNPLTVIQGIANVSLKNIKNIDINPSKIEEDMNKIIKMTKRSAKIIHGLRVFARDAAVDPMEKIDLNQVVEDTLELCKSRITYRNIRLDWSPIEECFCMGRAVQISQVLLNLLSNSSDAVENTIDPWIKIVINQKENFWNVSVIDSGPGIPEKIYQKMMSPFFTTKAPGKGTGLGLSISNSILNEHGGEFYYVKESPFTEFKFTLPIYKN